MYVGPIPVADYKLAATISKVGRKLPCTVSASSVSCSAEMTRLNVQYMLHRESQLSVTLSASACAQVSSAQSALPPREPIPYCVGLL